ncbi:hypothetical protein HOP50_20g86620 [Chloropicon primus]|nr:hypothetical protein HOP50_20g86620 [Chloropicon primus]
MNFSENSKHSSVKLSSSRVKTASREGSRPLSIARLKASALNGNKCGAGGGQQVDDDSSNSSSSSPPDLSVCKERCEEELCMIAREIDGAKTDLVEQFNRVRLELKMQEDALMATLDEARGRFVDTLSNQARVIGQLQRMETQGSGALTSTVAGNRCEASCPPIPIFEYKKDVRDIITSSRSSGPVLITTEKFTRLEAQANQLCKVEKELSKATKKLASTKEDLDKKKKALKRCNPLVPTDLVHHVNSSGWDCPEGGQQKFWDKFLQVSAMESIAVHTRPELLSCWVEQKSPSCAAASVAGACNILASRWRVLQMEQMQQSCESEECQGVTGGGAKAAGLPKESKAEVGKENQNPSAAGPCLRLEGSDVIAMYRSRWEKAVRNIKRDLKELLGISEHESGDDLLDALEASLAGKYGVQFHPKLENLGSALLEMVPVALEAWEVDEAGVKSEVQDSFSQNRKDIEGKVKTWWTKLGGLTKLNAEKPSTAPIGNETIVKITEKIREDHGVPLRTWRFMSSKRSQCQVAEADDDDKVTEQWDALKSCVSNPSQVLIFHLQNHYSMIYAARENQADEGYAGKRLIRQILVAKPGQQPCRWIDFTSVRETILSWVGHAILGVELEETLGEMAVL